ncbi:MAG: TlpA disulfide reductase family protein [Candidatus Pedobacter colombiensis]|uniref:TlpA disulfide reductase family protein n=1 Tax=Candidatus Pedobacter colombiensis TaxID=3121371 RepID=A0AAJ5WCP2_9SPHI|nr:TlpA disulfide reductase family protein [Pedobacter sp.]WEK21628.1 MAG: TlpA disulfide reductase family protein [Pedobacter sp.]
MSIYKLLVLAGIFGITATAFGQKVQLKGDIKGLGDRELAIEYYEGKAYKKTKVKVSANRFTWTASFNEPRKILIDFPKRPIWMYVEPGTMQISGNVDSLDQIKHKGSKIQDEADVYTKSIAALSSQEMALYRNWNRVDKQEQLALEQKAQEIKSQIRGISNKYIEEHPNSPFSLSLVIDRAELGTYKDVNVVYEKLSKKMKATSQGKALTERVAVLKRSEIGSPVFNFTQNDNHGKSVTFSEFIGKYVLIDFWASWCGPCRAENPNVLKAYNRYKDKNFTVVGISLDDNEQKWKKAIQDDGMPWTQLSDLKGAANEVSVYYGIMGIPSTLLVDPQGKIMARDLRGEMLNKKLEEIFKDK